MNRSDIYTEVTDIIVKSLEEGQAKGTWELPWHSISVIPRNAVTKKQYRGINVPILWIRQQRHGFKTGLWATYNQWLEAGAQVRKGEKATPVVFWKTIDVEPQGDDEEAGKRMFARHSNVFNADQVEGFTPPPPHKPAEIVLKEDCTRFIAATGASIEYGRPYACYNIMADKIEMPEPSLFRATKTSTATEAFFSTLCHETVHWSGAGHRLNRIKHKKFGDSDYAFEEMVAELGAAMLCASLGVTPAPRDDHAQYIKHWVKALGDHKQFIFSAASQAQKAVDYLFSLQPRQELAEAA